MSAGLVITDQKSASIAPNGVELRTVKLSDSVPYENPHAASHAASGDSSSEPSSHIDSVYDALGFPHRRPDGGINRAARASSLSSFHHDSLILVLLVSLKAGGRRRASTSSSRTGTPAVEQQAVDRLGQQRVVETVKLLARSTIEENIVALQARKRELARLAFKEGGGGGSRAASGVEEEEEEVEEEVVWGNDGGKGKGRGKGKEGAARDRREALRQESSYCLSESTFPFRPFFWAFRFLLYCAVLSQQLNSVIHDLT
ncbi:hypothetical protein DFJ73DRAFT_958737 [Zopfochytrium polystomum]|nr:hypothetical protein DFJ73DRAFT_958737 [Zopfochytrium polystomum]